MGKSCLKKLITWIDLKRRRALTSQENEEMLTEAVVKAVLATVVEEKEVFVDSLNAIIVAGKDRAKLRDVTIAANRDMRLWTADRKPEISLP